MLEFDKSIFDHKCDLFRKKLSILHKLTRFYNLEARELI